MRMTGLVLELRPGEAMIINGALVRFRTRSRIELVAKARFMFGKQIMTPEQADTPARRIYFALQTAYVGEEEERTDGPRHGARIDRGVQGGDHLGAGAGNPRPGGGGGGGR